MWGGGELYVRGRKKRLLGTRRGLSLPNKRKKKTRLHEGKRRGG